MLLVEGLYINLSAYWWNYRNIRAGGIRGFSTSPPTSDFHTCYLLKIQGCSTHICLKIHFTHPSSVSGRLTVPVTLKGDTHREWNSKFKKQQFLEIFLHKLACFSRIYFLKYKYPHVSKIIVLFLLILHSTQRRK